MAMIGDAVLDAGLNYLISNSDYIVACIGTPADLTEAQTDYPTGKRAGQTAITGADWSALANGDVSGRKAPFDGKDITISVSGITDLDVTTVAMVDSGTALLGIADLTTAKTVSTNDTLQVQAFDYEIQDPA